MGNPFTLMFGKEPNLTIKREDIISKIDIDFSSKLPSSMVYMLIGARGSGKTVVLSEIYNHFDEMDDWIVADVNPHRNILEDLASVLYEKGKVKKLFLKTNFSISFKGVSFSVDGNEPVTSIYSVIEKMLAHLAKQNKKVLVTLDEASTNDNVKEFAHDFQSFARKGYQLYWVMTGLYENVSNLQNDKSLTFLYRSPKILLEPLDLVAIQNSYKKVFALDNETAKELSLLTKGYGYGYQLLGHLFYDHQNIDESLLEEYDKQLRMNAYDKIYSCLGATERTLLSVIAKEESRKTADILLETGIGTKSYSVFRDRLLQKGLIVSKQYGFCSLALPRFKEFLTNKE